MREERTRIGTEISPSPAPELNGTVEKVEKRSRKKMRERRNPKARLMRQNAAWRKSQKELNGDFPVTSPEDSNNGCSLMLLLRRFCNNVESFILFLFHSLKEREKIELVYVFSCYSL